MPPLGKKLKKEIIDVRQQVRDKTAGYIVTALGLVAGLAWNDAIKSSIEYFFPPNESTSLWAKFIYATILTLFVAFISFYIVKFFKGETAEEKADRKKDAEAKTNAETK